MQLDVQQGTHLITSVELDRLQGVIGSKDNARIILKGYGVLPEHARIEQIKEGIILTPCSIKAKIYVNAQLIESEYMICENDIINIGSFSLIVQPDVSSDIPPRKPSAGPRKEITTETFLQGKAVKAAPESTDEKEIQRADTDEIAIEKVSWLHQKKKILALIVLSLVVVFYGVTTLFHRTSHVDNEALLEKVEQLYSQKDYLAASEFIEDFLKENSSDYEANELSKKIDRKIRLDQYVNNAYRTLKSESLQEYDESMKDLYDVFNDLNNIGSNPLDQILLRELIYDMEKTKLQKR